MRDICGKELQYYKGTMEVKECLLCGEITDEQFDSMINHLVKIHGLIDRLNQKECRWTHYKTRQRILL